MNIFFNLKLAEQRRADTRRCFFVCVALLLAASLGACTTIRAPLAAIPATAVGGELLAPYFSLVGRISVRVSDKVDSGQIRWSRGPEEERIGIYSPLGSQVAELVSEKRARTVTLRQGGETTMAASVEALTQSLLGVPLELDRMAEWVQGFGLRENENTDARLANGDVWRVTAKRYKSSGNYRFASLVEATRSETVVRLVIDEWTSF